MISRAAKGALMIGLLLLSTGCWNRRELNDLSIAVAMGLDAADNGGYTVSVQLVNPGQIATKRSGPEGSPVSTFHIEARSVFEALRKFTTQINRRIYLSHLRLLVFGEKLARRGIADPVDFLSRDHELRTDFFIVVAKNTNALNVLEILTPQQNIPANEMFTSLEMSERTWAATGKVTLDRLIDDLASEGKSPALTGLLLIGPSEKGKKVDNIRSTAPESLTEYDGMAVFKSDRLIGWLNDEQSKGFQYTQDKVKSTVIVDECPGGEMDVEIIHSETKMKGRVSNGKPAVQLKIRAEANVGDITCSLDLSDPQGIREAERMTERKIAEAVEDAVHTVQQRYPSDIFGFGEAVRRSSPHTWRKLSRDWDAAFAEMTVQTRVDVKIRRIGTIHESIQSRVRK